MNTAARMARDDETEVTMLELERAILRYVESHDRGRTVQVIREHLSTHIPHYDVVAIENALCAMLDRQALYYCGHGRVVSKAQMLRQFDKARGRPSRR